MNPLQRIANKIIRIIEGPPVRERTLVKVVNASERNRLKPCFLIGVYRSGTTLLRYVLDSHSNIAVPPETNFLHSLKEMHDSEWITKGLQGVGVDESGLKERLRDFAGNIFDDYALAKGKGRWVDKTPSYIDILDFIHALFGENGQYIMLYRHGLDVANSLTLAYERNTFAGPAKRYADEYKDAPRLAYTSYWVDQCNKMLAFEEKYPAQCFRILYELFAAEPAKYLPPLFAFLGESWEPEVLDFAGKQHDFGLQDYKILETKKFTPRTDTYRDWPETDLSQARRIAESTLQRLGYDV